MNITSEARTIRVAAIQTESRHGLAQSNREHAIPFIEKAVQAGAQLVVLPELFSAGYIPNETIWGVAEPKNGPTVTWLKQTSKRLCVFVRRLN